MSLLGLIGLLVLPLALGGMIAHLCWPTAERGAATGLFLAFIGCPVGLGLSAASYFCCSLLTDAAPVLDLFIEFGSAFGLLVLCVRAADRQRHRPRAASVFQLGFIEAILTTVFIQLAMVAFVVTVRAARIEPYGSWDGWAIWNFHARFIHRAGTTWPALLQSPQVAWSHPDYPLLVSANVARLWGWIGGGAPMASAALSLGFGAATVGLLYFGLLRRRGAPAALLSAIVLLSTPFFVTFSSNEHADIALGLYLLAACVLIADPEPMTAGRAALTGVVIGLAASVKNEGIMFAGIAIVGWFATSFPRVGPKALEASATNPTDEVGLESGAYTGRSRFAFAFGLLLALAPLAYFKLHLAPANDLASSHPLSRIHFLFDPARHRLILSALRRDFAAFGQWRWLPFVPLALGWIGPGWRRLGRADWAVAGILLVTFAGYYVVYLLTPFDLSWHLDSSLVRLLLQLWPSALFFWGLSATVPAATSHGWSALSSTRLTSDRGRARSALGTTRSTLLIVFNVLISAAILLALSRQLAPNEIAKTAFRLHPVHAVAAPDWYPAESDAHDHWSWSSGQSTLHLFSATHQSVRLRFALRGLRPQHLTARVNGTVVWTGRVDARLTKFQISNLSVPVGHADLVFTSDQPGLPEASDPGARTLAFALYQLRID